MNKTIFLAALASAGVATTAIAAPGRGTEIGVQGQLIPDGERTFKLRDDTRVADMEPAFGLVGILDFVLSPNVSIGAAPRLVFGLKQENEADSSTQLDLAVRLTLRAPVTRKASLFAQLSPAYSFIFLPDTFSPSVDDPSGLAIGVGGGVAFKLTPTLSLITELGYTWGFQSSEFQSVDFDATIDMWHVGVGLQAAI